MAFQDVTPFGRRPFGGAGEFRVCDLQLEEGDHDPVDEQALAGLLKRPARFFLEGPANAPAVATGLFGGVIFRSPRQ